MPVVRRFVVHISMDSSAPDQVAPTATRLIDLPDFHGPARLRKAAYKASRMVKPSTKTSNAKKRSAKHAAAQLDAYTQGISVSLREQMKTFKAHLRGLSPFEAVLADLTLKSLVREGLPDLKMVINNFDVMRRAVVREGKEASLACINAETKEEATKQLEEGMAHVEEVFNDNAEALFDLITTTQRLRRLPHVVTDEPIVVLVGMPNVGKSSIVTATSSGVPEINSYPFTTRRLLLGHVVEEGSKRYQVMDTPGVLYRADEDRNPMEGLTLASVELLPSAIVFVCDLSGTCGAQSSPRLQLEVREQIRAAFPSRPWIDVRSKADLPLEEGLTAECIPEGTLEVSVHEDVGVDELKLRMAGLIQKVRRSRREHPAA